MNDTKPETSIYGKERFVDVDSEDGVYSKYRHKNWERCGYNKGLEFLRITN